MAKQEFTPLLTSYVRKPEESFILPISADVKDKKGQSKDEIVMRCKLASLYRLMDLYGWTNGIWNHITVRLPDNKNHFLMNPLGLLYGEMTAGCMVKVDLKGNVIDGGNTGLSFSKSSFVLHSPIYGARPDINCIIHTHTPSILAVATMQKGLQPFTQDSLSVGDISYHDYQGVFMEESEMESIGKAVGPVNKIMLLRSHGVAVCGSTVEEAFDFMQRLTDACEQQLRILSMGREEDVVKVKECAMESVRKYCTESNFFNASDASWAPGQLEYEAEMRRLDYKGYQTGYPYKVPIWKVEKTTPTNEKQVKGEAGEKRPTKAAGGGTMKRSRRGAR